LRVKTTRFGELKIEDGKVIEMPDGMAGFSERHFIILNPEKGGPFCWFQALENPDLAFVVVEPARFAPDYQVKLTREEYDKLQLEPGDETVLLTTVTMNPDPRLITINLQGPIVINPVRMTARQVVLEGNFPARRLLPERREPVAARVASAAQFPTIMPAVSSLSCTMNLALACA
jgi:flagellar assembly factor FliW